MQCASRLTRAHIDRHAALQEILPGFDNLDSQVFDYASRAAFARDFE
jgi:hypothetical protein